MSNKAINYVFENSKTVGSARVLMLAIADMANDDGECWPGKAKLHSKVNVSVRMITRLIQECERLGELAVIEGEQNQTNRYLVIGLAAEKRVEKARPIRAKKLRAKRVTSDTRVTSEPEDITTDDTGVTTTGDTGVTQTLSNPSVNPQSTPEADAPAKPIIQLPKVKHPEMFGAITDAMGLDPATLTVKRRKSIGSVATELIEAGYLPEDVGPIRAWVKQRYNDSTEHAISKYAPSWKAEAARKPAGDYGGWKWAE